MFSFLISRFYSYFTCTFTIIYSIKQQIIEIREKGCNTNKCIKGIYVIDYLSKTLTYLLQSIISTNVVVINIFTENLFSQILQ